MTWFDWLSLVVAIVGSIAGLAAMLWATRRDTTRHDEDAARAFHEAHGHWPGEPSADEGEPVHEVLAPEAGAPPLVRRRRPPRRARVAAFRERLGL